MKVKANEFALPNELGWACDDEISDCIDAWVVRCGELQDTANDTWQVAKAELMDDIYTTIKKYQERQ